MPVYVFCAKTGKFIETRKEDRPFFNPVVIANGAHQIVQDPPEGRRNQTAE